MEVIVDGPLTCGYCEDAMSTTGMTIVRFPEGDIQIVCQRCMHGFLAKNCPEHLKPAEFYEFKLYKMTDAHVARLAEVPAVEDTDDEEEKKEEPPAKKAKVAESK